MQPLPHFILQLLVFEIISAVPTWRANSYYGVPVGENAVGSVIFDPQIGSTYPECYGTFGSVNISLISCPIAASNFFATSGNKITLASKYPLSQLGYSPVLPDCSIMCADSANNTVPVYATLTITIYNIANQPPVWSNLFPTNFTIDNLQPPQLLLQTPAIDPDIDKTSNGFVTYSVQSIDSSPVIAGINDFLQYRSNGTSYDLLVIYTLPWDAGTMHTVVITAKDNPINATGNTISKTISLFVSTSATVGSVVVFPTTASTAVYNSTGIRLSITSTATPCGQFGTSLDSVVCGTNWIWLVIGGSGVIAIIIVIIVAAVCFRRYGPNSVHHEKKRHPRHQNQIDPVEGGQQPPFQQQQQQQQPISNVNTARTVQSNNPANNPGYINSSRY